MASEWQGGPNFVWVKRGSANERKGGTGQGKGKNKNPALMKTGRFNPNPTRLPGHPNCQIKRQSDVDKKLYESTSRPIKFIPTGFRPVGVV